LDNLELVAGLSAQDRCLFERDVYPSGGVGYEDSSLPYDSFPPLEKAHMTLRAELIRANPDIVFDVIKTDTDPMTVEVVLKADSAGKSVSLDELMSGEPKALAASATLADLGVKVTSAATAANSSNEICELRALFHAVVTPDGSLASVFSIADAAGVLHVTVDPADSEVLAKVAAQYKDSVVLDVAELSTSSGRFSDSPAWYGGDRINAPFGNGTIYSVCSNSFRMGGTSMLTADHCEGNNFTNGIGGPSIGSVWSTLWSANIDAKLLAGQPYGNRIWTGGQYTTSSIQASGLYSYALLGSGAYLLASGASSYQITLSYLGAVGGTGCVNLDGRYTCSILDFWASANQCIRGDSGGPVGVYDPGQGRVVATGIVAGTVGSQSAAHHCLVTSMDAIQYLTGGSTIG
jgi:hypothetical protein